MIPEKQSLCQLVLILEASDPIELPPDLYVSNSSNPAIIDDIADNTR